MMSLAQQRKPNILLVISDDQSWDYTSINGAAELSTPAFDEIANRGALFNNAFCAAPACAPARASIFTGNHIWQNKQAAIHFSYFPRQLVTYPAILSEHGYHMGMTGKGWGPGNFQTTGWPHNPAGPAVNPSQVNEVRSGLSKNDYAANFIHFYTQKPADTPFCFWLGTEEPHMPLARGLARSKSKNASNINVPPFLPDTPEVREELLDYFAEIEYFDSHLQRVVQFLKDKGEFENTLIIVTSDNGMPFPRAKSNLYDHGTRMPLAVSWPAKIKSGQVSSAFVSHVDFAPTILDAAGIAVPPGVTGKSFLPLLVKGKKYMSKDYVVMGKELHACCRKDCAIAPVRAIRNKQYLYIWNLQPDAWPAGDPDARYAYNLEPFGDVDPCVTKDLMMSYYNSEDSRQQHLFRMAFLKRPAEELYDVLNDPYQLKNLAQDESHQIVKRNLRQQLEQELMNTHDPRMTHKDEHAFDNAPYLFSHGIGTGGLYHPDEWDKKSPAEKAKLVEEVNQKASRWDYLKNFLMKER